MAHPIIMPKQGLQMTEGTILKWLAAEGSAVRAGEPLFEMETDKLTITIDAQESGTLLKIMRGEGDTVPITELIAVVGEPGEDISALLAGVPEVKPAPRAKSAPAAKRPAHADAGKRSAQATPRAQALAAERGIDLAGIAGSGPDGLIVERDIPGAKRTAAHVPPRIIEDHHDASLAEAVIGSIDHHDASLAEAVISDARAIAEAAAADANRASEPDFARSVPTVSLLDGDYVISFNSMRRLIAERMSESVHEMAQARHVMHVEMTEAIRLRERLAAANIKVSYNDIAIRAVARALREHPMMNTCWTRDGVLVRSRVNVGMAVAVDSGLVVPVIQDADAKSLATISAEAEKFALHAREGALGPDDMRGGTFTVSNLGMLGVNEFTAIVNPPEAGILAIGSIEKRAVVRDDEVSVRAMMTLTLSYDHRVVDGAPAAKFLSCVRDLLESPALML